MDPVIRERRIDRTVLSNGDRMHVNHSDPVGLLQPPGQSIEFLNPPTVLLFTRKKRMHIKLGRGAAYSHAANDLFKPSECCLWRVTEPTSIIASDIEKQFVGLKRDYLIKSSE